MKSLSEFRIDLFKDFENMRDTGAAFEVYHRRKVYLLKVEPTDKKVSKPYHRKKTIINPLNVITTECEQCGSLLVNKICMNQKCSTNQTAI